jgi:phosphatidylglycerol:prolipoprotein diacylglycerol transferase
MGNFINGELVGPRHRPARGRWCFRTWTTCRATRRSSTSSRRRPLLFAAAVVVRRAAPRGAVSGMFLVGYGVFRFLAEFGREPDHGIFGLSYTVSMGQWLSLPMIVYGMWLLLRKKSGTPDAD